MKMFFVRAGVLKCFMPRTPKYDEHFATLSKYAFHILFVFCIKRHLNC